MTREIREVAMPPDRAWMPYSKKAAAEGWNMFSHDNGLFQLQRVDEAGILQGDTEALAYVVKKALAGSKMHLLALYLDGRPVDCMVYIVTPFITKPRNRKGDGE